jgi:hypothetical protein
MSHIVNDILLIIVYYVHKSRLNTIHIEYKSLFRLNESNNTTFNHIVLVKWKYGAFIGFNHRDLHEQLPGIFNYKQKCRIAHELPRRYRYTFLADVDYGEDKNENRSACNNGGEKPIT